VAERKGPKAPIDNPLSSAFLKEFHGWSTAYPPGISDPSSLRIAQNVLVTRDGALRVRPALRNVLNLEHSLNTGSGDDLGVVGSFEQFFVPETTDYTGKAFLFAVRAVGGIKFRAGLQRKSDSLYDIKQLTDPLVGFTGAIPSFSLNTMFIKYLQIDNKILALSDAGDPIILFNVGTTKTAKSVSPDGLTLPTAAQTLTVVHPDAAWINDTTKDTIPAAETPLATTLIADPLYGTVNISIASPGVLSQVAHGLTINQQVRLGTTGALPTGLTAGTAYYVQSTPTADTFTLSATPGGAAINTSGTQSGTHSLYKGASVAGGPMPSADTMNTYNFGFWFTFFNEFGESAPSLMTMVKTQRGWSQWKFNAPTAAGRPNGAIVTDPKMAADQLVAILPAGLLANARLQGAIGWNLYMVTWGDDNPVPSEGVLVASREITATSTDAADSWLQALAAVPAGSVLMALPDATTRDDFNFSKAPRARQGLVAGDRLILVNDYEDPAMIRWSSNQPTKYTDFSPSQGGGQKTLSFGNLLIPSAVKLWNNPQSVDTIVILCEGVDGYHASYYMAPAAVSGQSESTLIMGFEETTATPGTVSPYGVEVFDQQLYHPLESELMKSSASNYNITHKTLTDDIANKWMALINKRAIVSSQYDGYLYYIVDNPDGSWNDPVTGEPLDRSKYRGNEIWVLDAQADQPQWNRWLIPAIALRKLEVAGKLRLAVVTPETIYYLADEAMDDHYFPPTNVLTTRAIPWYFETNTMGANRAHNAWCRLQDVIVSHGNFYGSMYYGVKALRTVDDKAFSRTKIIRQPGTPADMTQWPKDDESILLLQKDIKEWVFFGGNTELEGVPESSFGQLNFAQFRYLPVSVNVDYEAGSIETFEYGRQAMSPNAVFGFGELPYGYGPYGG